MAEVAGEEGGPKKEVTERMVEEGARTLRVAEEMGKVVVVVGVVARAFLLTFDSLSRDCLVLFENLRLTDL